MEATWEPIPGLRFNFAGGYENATLKNGSKAIDLMDRADKANHPDWMVIKPFPLATSNCILPTAVVNQMISVNRANYGGDNSTPIGNPVTDPVAFASNNDAGSLVFACFEAWSNGDDPGLDYNGVPTGFDPTDPVIAQETNNGQGFYKNLSGNQLPNAPHFTTSLGADFTVPVADDWALTWHGDFYWQSQSFARVENDRPYDKLRGYSNVNLAMILTGASGWQVMGYVKNIFDTTAITGAFLNSDDTALTTNVFTTDPRLYGLRVTKSW